MIKGIKQRFGRVVSLLLVANLIFSLFVTADVLYPDADGTTYAAESSAMGNGNYTTGISGGATLTAGTTYSFGGYNWVAAEVNGNSAVLQSTGVTSGKWPGYTMSAYGNGNYYSSSIDGKDISAYDTKMTNLYNSIKAAEYTSASYGKGLYLVSNAKAGTTSSGTQGSGYYWQALKSAATNYSSFGAAYDCAWLGTVYGSSYAWFVYQGGSVYGNYIQGNSCVVAPAFNLDLSKVRLSGTALTVATFTDSTGISATQSIKSVEEGSTTDLASIITGVTYIGGDNNGKSGSYKISVSDGTISGTKWTAPAGLKADKNVTFTITEVSSGKNLYTTKTVTVTPRAAGSIKVETKGSIPGTMKSGESIDLAPHITVTGYDTASESDGELLAYTLSSNCGTFDGTTFTAGETTVTKDVTITVTGSGSIGSVSYSGKTATFKIKVKPDTTGWTDRDEQVDEKGFHTYTDDTTDITWKYKYDDDGYVSYLYTEDDVANIISDGYVLLVPSAINGVPVVGIGGGQKDGDVIPFIPNTGDNVNDTWKSIYFPSSVKTINDGAFYQNGATADIVIPGTVSKVGVIAFKESKIKSVTFNDANSLSLYSEAFAEIPSLTNVTIRGNGVSIGTRAFSNATGLTQIDIPNGTKFKGETDQNDSYAFQGTTGLELIKIDTDTVYSNIFSGNKNLAKVIFGENVTRVKYDWSGTAASNADTLNDTVARATYALNADTIFEMDKSTGGSPFGYANALTVVGKSRTLDGDTNAYVNTSNPVTAKIAYLATYYKTNTEVNGYAQGTGTSITITAEGKPEENDGVTSTVTTKQTGIEAYYNGIIFTGKKLEKNRMSVHKMFGNAQKGTYASDEFYVLRTNDADTLLTKDTANEKSGDNYVTVHTEDEITNFEEKDSITINSEDLKAGTVDVKIIVLLKDSDGRILVDHSNGHMQAYTYTVAIPVKEYTAEDDFLENYGSYSAVISTINDLNAKLDIWEQKIAELTGLEKGDFDDIDLVKEELDKKQKELATYVQMYNDLTQQLKDLVADTNLDDSGYIAEVGGQKIVYVNGQELVATPTGDKLDGKDLYTSTGDVGNGSQTFEYYVDADGVHIVKVDGVVQNPEIIYSDSIRAMQRKLTAQITALRTELSNYGDIIPQFKELLNITETNFDQLSGPAQLQMIYSYVQSMVTEKKDIDKALDNLYSALQAATGDFTKIKDAEGQESAADKINSITSMVQTLSSNYDANNAYLRNCIIEINRSFGYGDYVKYNGKYVFAIYQNDSFVYYVKNDSGRTYLYYDGTGNFTEVTNDEAASLATAYDAIEGEKFMVLTDTTNGWNPYVTNPLSTYKKAMSVFIAGFNNFDEKSDELLAAVNAINGKQPGDEGYLSIPEDATAEEMTAAAAAALETVKGKLNALELTRSLYAENIKKISDALNGYLNLAEEFSGDFTEEELAAIVQAAADAKAELEGLKGDMADIDAALNNLFDALSNAFDSMGIEGGTDLANNGRGDETTADKIESIGSMVTIITESYNSLKADYAALETDYQKVIDYVYGEDEKTVDQVTAQQIITQIDKNQQDAITAAVNEALKDADNFETQSIAVQQSIATTIDKILDGESVDTSELDPTLQTQLAEIKSMKTEIDGMKTGSDAYASFLETLRDALSLDDTADAAKILESIQGLKSQVATLTSQLNEKAATISKIQTKLSTQADGDDLVALVGTGTADTSGAYNNGYNAGYIAGQKATSNSNSNTGDYQTGYTAGYNAGYVAGTKASNDNSNDNSTEEVSSLLKENATLQAKNEILSSENTTLSDENAALTKKNDNLTSANNSLVKKVNTLSAKVTTLKKQNSKTNSSSKTSSTTTNSGTANISSAASYNSGYSAGYNAGQKAVSKSNTSGNSSGNSGKTVSLKSDEEKKEKQSETKQDTDTVQQSTEIQANEYVSIDNGVKTMSLPPIGEVTLPDNVKMNGFDTNSAYVANVTSNCLSVTDTMAEAKEHANIFFNYYASNLSSLADLGSKDVEPALTDDTLEVELSALLSVDVQPTAEQQELMDNAKPVTVTLTSNDFTDDAEYLVVHESTVRSGSYDVLVATAENGAITMELEDLSPISIARISVREPVLAQGGLEQPSESKTQVTDQKSTGGLKVIFIALVLIAGLGGVVLLIYKSRTVGKTKKTAFKRN